MSIKQFAFILATILFSKSVLTFGQEICNNGIDDDGNGFVDSIDVVCNTCDSITQLNFEDGLLPSSHGWVSAGGSSSIVNNGSSNVLDVSGNNTFYWYYDLDTLCLNCDWSFDYDYNAVFTSGSIGGFYNSIITDCQELGRGVSLGWHHYRFERKAGIYRTFVDGVQVGASTSGGMGNALRLRFYFSNITQFGHFQIDNVSFLHCSTNCSCALDTAVIYACDSALIHGNWYSNSQVVTDILTSSTGCDSVVITDLKIQQFTDFENTVVCEGDTTFFFDNNIYLPGSNITGTWHFGDGNVLNYEQSAKHLYAGAGSYSASLIINTDYGCIDTNVQNVVVLHKPVASYVSADVCLNDSTHFINTSSIDPGGTINSYLWNFGDGTISNLQNPAHQYAAGTYSPVLIVTSADMCVDSVSHTLNTFDVPTSAFTASNTCLFDSAEFTNTSTDPLMGNLAEWYWNFGDGTSINSTDWNPNHLYTIPGDYDVMLISHSSNLGCADTLTVTVMVFPMPVADFNAADVCLNEATNFNDASSVSVGNISFWGWDFGDGTPVSGQQNPTHTYAAPGTDTVSLIVTSNNGCADTITKSVSIHPLPVAAFSTSNVCDGFFAQFTNTSSITGSDIIQINTWEFGDGAALSNQNASHLYAAPSGYDVQLLVVSNFGCMDSVTHTIVISPNPTVNFGSPVVEGCEPLCISLIDSSSITSGNMVSWIWNFGDGSPVSTSQDQQHCYTNSDPFAPALYSPVLTVVSDSGCITTVTKTNYIKVFPAPEAGFIAEPNPASIINPVVSIANLSVGSSTWLWDFGDTGTSSMSNPLTHTYADTGIYQIMLITATQYGCIDTVYQTVIVEPEFVLFVPNAFSPNGDGINDVFICKTMFYSEFEMIIFDRWGNLIYTTDSIDKPWDGRANNGAELAQMDVYVYSIKAKDLKGEVHTYRGTVTLIK